MAIVLYRIDERLIHGQVVVGWGRRLDPDRYVVVDDEVAENPWEQDLYLLGLPEGVEGVFVTVDDGRARLQEWQADSSRTLLLTRDVAAMLELARTSQMDGVDVNVGGIHHSTDRREVLPYVHLNDDERGHLQELEGAGARISAQDLPGSRKMPLGELLQ